MAQVSIKVQAIIHKESLKPAVILSFENRRFTFNPEDAMGFAKELMQTAVEAAGDGVIINFLTKECGVDAEKIVPILTAFHQYRTKQRAK